MDNLSLKQKPFTLAVIEELERDLKLADQGGCAIVLSTNQVRQIVALLRTAVA